MPRYSRKNRKNRKIQVGGVKGDGGGYAPTSTREKRSAQPPSRYTDPQFETSLRSPTSPTSPQPFRSTLFDKLFRQGYSSPPTESGGEGAVFSPFESTESYSPSESPQSSFLSYSPTIALTETLNESP